MFRSRVHNERNDSLKKSLNFTRSQYSSYKGVVNVNRLTTMKINRLQSSLSVVLLSLSSVLAAEIVLDGTLGSKGALVGPDFLIKDTMGQQIGGNLFHSFESFNVNTGESATFIGPSSVENILTRVTGGNRSVINGTLRSEIPNANFYLLNPSGILFAKNARLDIAGSFQASTADYLRLGEEGRFSARYPVESLLTVAPPQAFGFLDNPAPITLQDSLLSVHEDKTLSVLGGDLQMDNSALYAPDGQVNLVSVASAGEVIPSFSNTAEQLGTITLSQSPEIPLKKMDETEMANIDTSGINGGHIFIQGGKFFSRGGRIYSQVAPSLTQTKVGSITIETQEMTLQDNSSIKTDTFSSGEGGDITITATDNLTMIGSGISVASGPETTGNAGTIQLNIGQLTLQEGSFLDSSTLGSGKGGDITITATQGVSLFKQDMSSQQSLITSSVGNPFTRNSAGHGGEIRITTPRLELKDRGVVQTGAFKFTSGNAGNIWLKTDHLILNNLGIIISSTLGSGSGGSINIFSTDIEMNSGSIKSRSVGKGNAGSIAITTKTASLNDLSLISTLALYAGGGNIEFNVRDHLYLFDSGITASAQGNQPQHSGGNLTISTPSLLVLDKSKLNASAYAGNGGNIRLIAEHLVQSTDNLIDASSELGLDGKIEIISLEEELTDNFSVLPSRFFDATLPTGCAARSGTNFSRFLVTGPEILPESPHALSVHISAQLLDSLNDKPNNDSNTSALNSQISRLFMGCRRHSNWSPNL
jgi:filamentous hemagglutinin family protein